METGITGGTAELARRIYWVGSIDWNGRETSGSFTGLPPGRGGGTTCNFCLIVGEKLPY